MKPTLVIGAHTDPTRYAYKAIKRLRAHGDPVTAFGLRSGTVDDVEIETEWNENWKIDTVTLYINPQRQEGYTDKIIALKPKRVIFNPGTENPEFIRELQQAGIEAEVACTLVLLSLNQY